MIRIATFLYLAFFILLLTVPAVRGQQAKLDGLLDREMPSLLSTYKSLHAAPELSHHEEKTSAFVAGSFALWDTRLQSTSANTPGIRNGSATAWWAC